MAGGGYVLTWLRVGIQYNMSLVEKYLKAMAKTEDEC